MACGSNHNYPLRDGPRWSSQLPHPLTHDGGYATLAGKAVALEPATGFTFDTPLLPRPR